MARMRSPEESTLTQDRLKQLLHYNPETGLFTWLERRGSVEAGERAGCMDRNGYLRVCLEDKQYLAHRLAFLYMLGKFSSLYCDHINGDRSDNRFENLREATALQNQRNMRLRRDNTSGYKGVTFVSQKGKYRCQIRVMKKLVILGHFDCPRLAAITYNKAASEFYGEFAKLNIIGDTPSKEALVEHE